jgi:Putative translation initiation inhibitor, yjgF family
MSVTLLDPEGLPQVPTHRQVSIASGSRLVFTAGQVAWDASGRTIGEGDLAAQLEQCYLNVSTALAAAGASFDDVVKLTLYFVDWTPDKLAMAGEGIARAAETLGITALPPLTGIGVAALAEPGLLVEVEATAVLD